MSVVNSIFMGAGRKSAGNVTLRRVKGRTIASQKITENSSKSWQQVRQRMRFKWANTAAQFFNPIVNHSFVTRGEFESSSNAFTKQAIPAALTIGRTAENSEFPWAPASMLIARGNYAPYGLAPTITGSGSTSQNVQITLGGGLSGLNGEDYNNLIALRARGTMVGDMITFVFVVFRSSSRMLQLVWQRNVLVSSEDSSQEYSSSYDQLISSNDAGDVVAKNATDTIVAAAIIRSHNANTSSFDVATTELVALDPQYMRLVLGVELSTSVAPISSLSDDDFALDAAEMGWPVDESRLLAPSSMGYTTRTGGGMGEGVIVVG